MRLTRRASRPVRSFATSVARPPPRRSRRSFASCASGSGTSCITEASGRSLFAEAVRTARHVPGVRTVDVDAGEVTLYGAADIESQHEAAVRIALRVPGGGPK